ncbi:hypothetical protein BUALT_Bualt13G0056300 [Buddleja alternifolia]|uniref:DUF4283 domain-containing protein n=1 Tax=Buddleja alternifolia TaxID=168488 RepID=A0AAV6WW37_9LAMI|nr:hypothetical protein BUALT_Bualt13G0056300 [Buddleja alternifolia]
MINGRKTILLSKEEDDFMAAPYQCSPVGIFSHGYPTMTRLRAKFAALGLLKGFKIGVLDNKHVWIRLFDPNDYARVWMKQTWYFDGFPMRVLKWTSNFDPKKESPIMPIWIKVFGLRPHWFHRQFLYHVASLIGKPLKLDEATTKIENPVVARICAEINVLDKFLPDIPIQIDGDILWRHAILQRKHKERLKIGYTDDMRRRREMATVDSSLNENEDDNRFKLLTLGNAVDVPDNDGTFLDSGEIETSDESWNEVSYKKHRLAASLDENSGKKNANNKQLILTRMMKTSAFNFFLERRRD